MKRVNGTAYAYRESDGREIEYALEYVWTPERPPTYWEPAEGGVEPWAWYRDGQCVPELPRDVEDELLAEAWDAVRDERMFA